MSGLYLHIPFCKHKCLYCDFYTGGSRIADWQVYAKCLINELKLRKDEISEKYETLYFGGGTPSLIPTETFKYLTEGLKKVLSQKNWDEFTIEVNPEDVTKENTRQWKKSGVDRISIGIQTLNDSELISIGRRHDSITAENVLKYLIKEFGNISIDLMFGLPNQTLESYNKTLDKILKIKPPHISSYALMLEEGTALTLLEKQGKIKLPKEEEWIQMSDLTTKRLLENGYNRYEISNFSLEGYESKHNYSYWEGLPYLGLGPGAHSYDGKRLRRANPNNIKGYLKFFDDIPSKRNNSNFFIEEILTEEELREEMILTRMRTTYGLKLEEYKTNFGVQQKETLLKKAEKFIKSGYLKEGNDKLIFTNKGFQISDTILTSLI